MDSFDEADAGLSDALVPDEHGRSADHLEDCHSSNITAMKKKEHESRVLIRFFFSLPFMLPF